MITEGKIKHHHVLPSGRVLDDTIDSRGLMGHPYREGDVVFVHRSSVRLIGGGTAERVIRAKHKHGSSSLASSEHIPSEATIPVEFDDYTVDQNHNRIDPSQVY